MSTTHIVQAGECLASIAYEHGFFWETLWNHPDNAALKERRSSPFHLLPGDEVVVPEKRLREETRSPEEKHTFKLKGVPVVMIVTVMRLKEEEDETAENEDSPGEEPVSASFEDSTDPDPEEEPAANVPYRVDLGPRSQSGTTDAEGKARIFLSPADRTGQLVVEPGTPRERVIELLIGGLDPLETPTGVAQRLNNLGFGPAPCEPGTQYAQLAEALAAFQMHEDLDVTGEADEATLTKLEQVHGS
jgi:hypothetical protein